MYQDQHARRGTARKANNQHFYEKAIASLVEHGFVVDGQTPTETYRTGNAGNPIYGASGGKLCTVGGRQRLAKPGTAMKATVGKITTCFYEVRDSKTQYAITIRTRDTDRIKKWAMSEVCFKRSDAIAMGREKEWLDRNRHWLNINECPSCKRVFIDGETCSQGGCPMGGDV
jgi:hypothetical protein